MLVLLLIQWRKVLERLGCLLSWGRNWARWRWVPCECCVWRQPETGTRGFSFGAGCPLAGPVYCRCWRCAGSSFSGRPHRWQMPSCPAVALWNGCPAKARHAGWYLQSIVCLRLPSPTLWSDALCFLQCFSRKGEWSLCDPCADYTKVGSCGRGSSGKVWCSFHQGYIKSLLIFWTVWFLIFFFY